MSEIITSSSTVGRSKTWIWIILFIVIIAGAGFGIAGLIYYFRNKSGPTGPTGSTGTGPIKIDCLLSEWSAWSDCSNNSQTRTRRVIREPQFGGATCENLVETQFCGKIDCSMSDWVYGPCIDGSQNATRTILIPPIGEGATVCGATAGVFSCVVPKVYLSITQYNNSDLGPVYLSIRKIENNDYLVPTMRPTETNSGFTLGSNSTLKYNNQFVNINRDTGVLSFTDTLSGNTIVVDQIDNVNNRLLLNDNTTDPRFYIGSITILLNNIQYRVYNPVIATNQSIINVGKNNNLSVVAKPLFFKIPNATKYLETYSELVGNFTTNLSDFAYITVDNQGGKIYNDNTKYYLDLATNYLLKDNCYISFNNTNTQSISSSKNCDAQPKQNDLIFVPASTTDKGVISTAGGKIQLKTSLISNTPTTYYVKQDVASQTLWYDNKLILVTDINTASVFDIINNPPITKYLNIINNNKYLAIRTISNKEYFYLSDTPIEKFYLSSPNNFLLILKDNQYQYIKLIVNNTTNAYDLTYTTIIPLLGNSNYKGYIRLSPQSQLRESVNTIYGLPGCLGETTIDIGGLSNQPILTWLNININNNLNPSCLVFTPQIVN
jgi:hypothetical protein